MLVKSIKPTGELSEGEQRGILQSNGWIPLGILGEGGGARVFKVVSMRTRNRLATALRTPWNDSELADRNAVEVAQLIAEIAEDTSVAIAAGKVAKSPDARLKREINILRDVQHPNLIELIDSDIQDSPSWYVMPIMRGGTLKDANLVGNIRAVARGMLDVARALAAMHAHENPIVHRDIKPGNVFLSPDRTSWIVGDPGVAYREDGADETKTRAVSKDWFPRWYEDELGHSPKVDLYLLAGTALSTLVGAKPLAPNYLSKPKFDLPHVFPNAPGIAELHALMRKLLVDEPTEMPFATATDLVPELERLLQVVEDDEVPKLRHELTLAAREPQLVLTYAVDGPIHNGDVGGLKLFWIRIPHACSRLVFWPLTGGNRSLVAQLYNDAGNELMGEAHLQSGNANALLVDPALRGQMARLTIAGHSGFLISLAVYAEL